LRVERPKSVVSLPVRPMARTGVADDKQRHGPFSARLCDRPAEVS
jgi:hypothetical protein